MAVTSESPAPYAPTSSITDLIQRYRNKGLATPFTPDVLVRAGVSDSLVARTMQALQTLEIISPDGMPTETLEALRRAKEPEFQGMLAAWVKSVYRDVLSFVDPTDSEETIRDAFRPYNPVGQQPRMVSLFVGLCRAAGLRPDDPVRDSRPRPAARKVVTQIAPSRKQPSTDSGNLGAGASAVSAGMPPALAGLMNSLPASGQWTQSERDRFLHTFSAVLDFCFQIKEREVINDE